MHEKNKYRHIPWNRYNLEKYRDINFWSYRPALRYHNFAQSGILYPAVPKCTCRCSASQIAAQTINVTTEQHDGLNGWNSINAPKINK